MFRFLIPLFVVQLSFGQTKQTPQQYIDKWKDVAIKEMYAHKIPASITLAQGILESGSGNSRLSVKGNNHFGIKCHSTWTGKKIYADDDKKQECFRKYNSASESFSDHSLFLKKRRYASLFELDITNYKGWAKGLKKAGYATNPKYPQLLINLIERYNLNEYDNGDSPLAIEDDKETNNNITDNKTSIGSTTVIIGNKHEVLTSNNRVPYIITRKGDNIKSICKEYDMRPWQIYRYNDIRKGTLIKDGEIIYLKPKRWKAKQEFHIVKDGETMYSISQKHAIKLKKLYKKNRMLPGTQPLPGEKLNLRKKKTNL